MGKTLTSTVLFIGGLLFVHTLINFRANLIPLTMAVMLALMLMPLVNALEHYLHFPRMLAAVLVLALLIWAFYPLSSIIYASLSQFVSKMGTYESQLNVIINQLAEQFRIDLTAVDGQFEIRDWFLTWLSNSTAWLIGSANKFLGFAAKLVIILFFALFILNERNLILRKIHYLLSGENNRLVNKTITTITNQIGRYLLLKTATSLVTGVLVYFSLRLFKVEAPLTWAFFTFILNFIPNIGSVVITLLIGTMALIQFYPSWNYIIAIFLTMVGIQMVIGNIIDPKLQGDQLDISPLVILIALVFWGAVWGLEGMFLAVPLTETIKIICANTNKLQPVSVFIASGRALPPLPSERYNPLRKLFTRRRR